MFSLLVLERHRNRVVKKVLCLYLIYFISYIDMNRLIFILLLGIIPFLCFSENPKEQVAVSDTTVYTVVDKMPEFPGGKEAMEQFIRAEHTMAERVC
jgi:hypothetical protein